MEREMGGGIGMGSTCKSMADSCQCIAKKTLQYCEVISLQLIKINEEEKKKESKSNGDTGIHPPLRLRCPSQLQNKTKPWKVKSSFCIQR